MKKFLRLLSLLAIFILFSLFLPSHGQEQSFDLLILNGTILDGTGNPWFKADIGIRRGTIEEIGYLSQFQAKKTIDASGLTVTPGFIDVHTHCDRGILQVPTADNYAFQGVTTVIGGNCGGHEFPLTRLFQQLEGKGISLNFGSLLGHNTLRRKVMEYKMEAPSQEEIEEMKSLVDQEMKAGALGLSTGLAYLPGIYADTDEIIALASVVARYGGIYASHIRDQKLRITEAIQEAIEVGEKNSIPVQISHIKLADDAVWGQIERITQPIEEARGRGIEVTIDQYPYTATSSGLTSSFPSWCFEGGREKFLERLDNKELYKKVKSYVIKQRLTSTRGIDKPKTIIISRCERFPEFEGKNLEEILLSQGKNPTTENAADLIIEIQRERGAQGIFFQMDEKDVEMLMRLPYNMHASDGGIQVLGEGVPHPRSYGTFPRIISHYVRKKGILKLEEAIRKMTSLPAQTFRLKKRGMIREGMFADIVIFDYHNFGDMATFSDPHQFSQGLIYLIVNGEMIIAEGKHTGKKPGKILYGHAAQRGDCQ